MSSKERFKNLMGTTDKNSTEVGECLISKKEYQEAKTLLDVVIRKLVIDNNITKEEFSSKFKVLSSVWDGMDSASISNRKGNLYRALKSGNITFRKFVEFVCGVLGYEMVEVKFTFKKPDGKSYKVNLVNEEDGWKAK